jgi:hypothetical protein
VVRSNWNTDGTLPLCSVTALHLPGRCHCVCCGSHRWWGPRESCSHGRGMAPHSHRPCTVRPLSPAHLSALDFSPPSPYWTLLSFSLLTGTVARTPPCQAYPVLSFLLSPHSNSHQERTMAMLFPISCPTGDPLPRRLRFRCAAPPPPSTRL